MNLNIYLHFNGNCREAFEFYRVAFGGEFDIVQTFADMPSDAAGGMPIPEAERDNIMHVSLPVGDSVLMGSDHPSFFGPPPVAGNNFSATLDVGSRAEADALFAKLSEGGAVEMEMADMFWGSYFGSCRDKFGIGWQISCDAQ